MLAKHDAPAVNQFEHYGTSNKQMAVFHRYNSLAKFFYCLAVSLLPAEWPNTDLLDMLFRGVLSALWIWLVFDPVLNISRSPKRKLFYLGMNDSDGRFWNGTFGKYAGQWKFAVLFFLIVIINYLNHRYEQT